MLMLGWPWFDLIVAPPCARVAEGTRARLLRVARRLVQEEGLEALTLEAVARRARVGRGAPRYHFGGKRGLLEALSLERRARPVTAGPAPGSRAAPGRVRRPEGRVRG
ncbi:TetR/AcrR family transcriptional regulator [Myxococcus sp. K15C18031901]|uniref:helix-turn-helix domain-containing protein n=1 Tax=Myxococcus dinghuensis TaxID=2906761 RepID=UPI0020A78D2B|nr:helix-turn-helix domain-containing protein [Myxococcus dinghuensis]MCP3098057.1 TetR/AcrR family transcriptional regulator [Myxococcus dinghuensis]